MTRTRVWARELGVPFQGFQDELTRVLAHYRHLAGQAASAAARAEPTEMEATTWVPSVDLVEMPDHVALHVDLPGIDPSAIDLSVTGNVLTIRGERASTAGNEGREHVMERPFGPFARQVPLPCEVDGEGIRAETRLGVLEVHLPKAQAARPISIPVRPS